jgi:hypothetical protein
MTEEQRKEFIKRFVRGNDDPESDSWLEGPPASLEVWIDQLLSEQREELLEEIKDWAINNGGFDKCVQTDVLRYNKLRNLLKSLAANVKPARPQEEDR